MGFTNFKNKWCKSPITGESFQSQGEMARYHYLLDQQKLGKIKNLRRQVRFKLEVNGIMIATYIADFGYFISGSKPAADVKNGFLKLWDETETIEDFKGILTTDCKMKLKLMEAIHGIKVKITKKPTETIRV